MDRVFKVRMSHPRNGSYVDQIFTYEVVAPTGEQAIAKARAQARRDDPWRGAWLIEKLLHRGAAV